MRTDESLTAIPEQSANVWWSEHLGRPIPVRMIVSTPVSEPATVRQLLGTLGLGLALFGLAAWIVALVVVLTL